MVASDRISAYDVVLPTPIPDKGAVLTRMSVFWFETTGDICPNHMISADVPGRGRGSWPAGQEARHVPGRVRRPRLHHRLGLEGVRKDRRGLRHQAARGPSGVRRSFPSRSSPRRPRPRSATTTRTSRSSARWRSIGDRGADGEPPRHLDRPLRARRGARCRARDHHRRHQVRVRRLARAPRSSSATRSSRPTPRASGRPTTTRPAAASPPSTSSTCATGSTSRAGTTPRPVPTCPTRSSRAPAPSTSRRTSASPAATFSRGAHVASPA